MEYSVSSNFWGWPENPWHDWVGYPRYKLFSEKDSLVLQIELPGIKKDNIRVYVKENKYLCLEVKEEKIDAEWGISSYVDTDKISAEYLDGILAVSMPPKESSIKEITVA